jgi:hypothetical protein
MRDLQSLHDSFYTERGPCCAGCDHWRFMNSHVGECLRSPPVGTEDRIAVLGMRSSSLRAGGHILTPRDHHCGEFRDSFDWSSLPQHYLRQIGRSPRRTGGPA